MSPQGTLVSTKTQPTGKICGRVAEERKWELLLLDEDGEGVGHLGRHFLTEHLELLLANDTRIAKPAAVWLDAGAGQLLALQLLHRAAGERWMG